MNKMVTRIFGLIAAFVFLYVGLSLFSSASQLANLLDQFSPGLGRPSFFLMCALLSMVGAAPVVLFYRLPKPLIPPASASGTEYEKYIQLLRYRLIRNKHLIGNDLETDEQIKTAITKLATKADDIVKQHASSVFVSTALMQNGRLDGLIVLFMQFRMIWMVACIFFQRPSPRQMLFLYGNVGTNVVLAQNIQEIEFAELAAPLVISIVPSLNGAIPGLQGVSNLILNSLATGSANAFLTLRVGIMARMYCESLSTPKRATLRTNATREALTVLGSITKEQGNRIAKGALTIVTNKFRAIFKGKATAGAAPSPDTAPTRDVDGRRPGKFRLFKRAATPGDVIGREALTTGEAVGRRTSPTAGAVRRGFAATGEAVRRGTSATASAVRRGTAATGGALTKGAGGVKRRLRTPIGQI